MPSFRSLLFTPATRLDRVGSGRRSNPDWLALDLEDAVPTGAKDSARAALSSALEGMPGADAAKTAVRINSLSTPEGIRDIAAMLEWRIWPGMVILPKVESLSQVRQVRSLATACGKDPTLLATLETARGVAEAARILSQAGPNVAAAYGSADHSAETGGAMTNVGLAFARGQVVNAAAVAGIPAIDGACLDFNDDVGLAEEAARVREMGFAGKIAIHPRQVSAINAAFSPSPAEIAEAREMCAAWDAAGGGAVSFRGRMLDLPVLARARRIVKTNGVKE